MPTREEIEQSRQEGIDARNAAKLEKAYTKSLTNTEYAPEKKDPRDAVRGQRGYAKGGKVSPDSKRFDDDREPGSSGGSRGTSVGAPGGDDEIGAYKRGGKVSSASKRADGIASKGKTRGTMVAMCGGGMMKRK